MKKKVYIQSVSAITAQKTFVNNEFLEEIQTYEEQVIPSVNPVYKDYIPPAAARRMAKGIKMGVVASKIALEEAGLENVDAIITGTGMGCVRDSEKFVSAIIDNDEQYLTPTSFIQSTHNTVGGQIALGMGCKGYNFTYVHSSTSFESALLDAKMQLELEEANTILVGGVDELGEHTILIHKLIDHIKATPIATEDVLTSTTKGSVFSEGASFFVLNNKRNDACYAEVSAVEIMNTLSKEHVLKAAKDFLAKEGKDASDVDALVLGYNGDVEFDSYYDVFSESDFSEVPKVHYKHLVGEYKPVSSFGLWLGANILNTGTIPEAVVAASTTVSKLSTILLYNQYRGENHSFVLLQQC
jgi:3-oxoacyl-(acyl-carrier-protein) synthase